MNYSSAAFTSFGYSESLQGGWKSYSDMLSSHNDVILSDMDQLTPMQEDAHYDGKQDTMAFGSMMGYCLPTLTSSLMYPIHPMPALMAPYPSQVKSAFQQPLAVAQQPTFSTNQDVYLTPQMYPSPTSSPTSPDLSSTSSSPVTQMSSLQPMLSPQPSSLQDPVSVDDLKISKPAKKAKKVKAALASHPRVRKPKPSSAVLTTALSPASDDFSAKLFLCTESDCDKVFKRSEHLKRHIRSIHTKEKRKPFTVLSAHDSPFCPFCLAYECPYQSCCKRFSRSDNLNQHIRIHRPANDKTSRQKK
ncbi:hypothetical protein DM01DRAFT_147122 [Hesseltinella vesiculosa]|uniref:C2H2-type domain-containing protein n=1 Tax=Hesseltinella vesiculosa TaxID=101127 RepID=A0A1X2GYI0_9FUNG|nr:hypothetical protein DM01DRAFT_147122 [Hesseltinella vesiculosa]